MVAIDEGTTNQGFLLELLGRPELLAGEVDTGWLDRLQADGDVEPVRHADAALVQAAIALCEAATAAERGGLYALARRGRPHAEAEVCHTLDLLHRGVGYRFQVCQTGPRRFLVEVDGARIEATVEQLTEHERRLSFGGRSHRTVTALQDADLLVVVAIPVEAGDEVHPGDVVAVTESMKMENSLTATVHGRVREVLVSANAHVPAGKPLLQVDPIEDGADAREEGGKRLRFEPAELDGPAFERLEHIVLGYDFRPAEVERALAAEAEGLPEHFVAHLRRALAHYGVEGLERTGALEEAAYRLFLARQRA